MTITTEEIEALKAAYEKATKGSWEYRLCEHDDWGMIRSAYSSDGEGTGYVVALSKAGKYVDIAAHRASGNDPYETNGRFIVAAHNLMPALLDAAEEAAHLRAELARVEAERDEAIPWKLFYGEGMTLGEVATHFGKSIYAFSPWLTAPLVRSAREAAEEANADRDAALSRAERARREAIEECARIVDDYRISYGGEWPAMTNVAANIRALLDAPADGKREGE